MNVMIGSLLETFETGLVSVQHVTPGMWVLCDKDRWMRVRSVDVSHADPEFVDVCTVGALRTTPWQRVYFCGEWNEARYWSAPSRQWCPGWATVTLDFNTSIVVDGVKCATPKPFGSITMKLDGHCWVVTTECG